MTQPHDSTNFVWDELKFIPIIGSTTGIEVRSILFSFPFLTSRLPIKKKLFYCPSISNPNYLPPPHQKPKISSSLKSKSNVAEDGAIEAMLKCYCKKQCCTCVLKQCYRSGVESNVAKDGAIEAMLKCCCKKQCCTGVLKQCCKSGVEAVL